MAAFQKREAKFILRSAEVLFFHLDSFKIESLLQEKLARIRFFCHGPRRTLISDSKPLKPEVSFFCFVTAFILASVSALVK